VSPGPCRSTSTGARSGVTGGNELAEERGEVSDEFEFDNEMGRGGLWFGFESKSLDDVEERPDKPTTKSGRTAVVIDMV
jgi:hypothetical protein